MTYFTDSNYDFDNIVRGYHGTHLKAAQSILDNGFRLSTNDYDWLRNLDMIKNIRIYKQ